MYIALFLLFFFSTILIFFFRINAVVVCNYVLGVQFLVCSQSIRMEFVSYLLIMYTEITTRCNNNNRMFVFYIFYYLDHIGHQQYMHAFAHRHVRCGSVSRGSNSFGSRSQVSCFDTLSFFVSI